MLLDTRQLTPTQFADAIGIARPIVSHILSGRNKPSLEVVQRILAAMPDLSMAWLLNGTGPMQASASTSTVAVEKAELGVQPVDSEEVVEEEKPRPFNPSSISSAPQAQQKPIAPIQQSVPKAKPVAATPSRPGPKRFAASAPKASLESDTDPLPGLPQPPVTVPVASSKPEYETEATSAPLSTVSVPDPAPVASALITGSDKPIRRIVIFYRDGSFTDYQPE